MSLTLQAAQRAATPAEVDAALARLDHHAGMYFGVDAGIAGLHPLQATLVDQAALQIRVHGDGLSVQALAPLGTHLLAQATLRDWVHASRPGGGRHPVASLRALLPLFAPCPDLLLLGALRFDAHLLMQAHPLAVPLGVVFLPASCWRRDAHGAWRHLCWSLPGAEPPPVERHPVEALADEPIASTTTQVAGTPGGEVQDDHPPGGHAAMVARALAQLRAQPLVSLTLSQSFRRRTGASAAQAFARLRAVNPAPAVFFVNDGDGSRLFGASPDLQLVVAGGTVGTLPVCGTVARGPGPVGEAESFRELVNEAVDAASLAVCSDALRNDLAPLCEPGSLQLVARRRQMSLATVVHTVDLLQGQLRAGVDAWDAIVATTAPAMVTGAPRALALQAIEQLEASPRGWYGGLAIQVEQNGDALVGTLLRAAVLRDCVAEVRTGGDLLADSVPEREEQESRLKAISLWRALGLEDSASSSAAATTGAEPAPLALPATVRLIDSGDPFPGALRDMLAGLGVALEGAALGVSETTTAPAAPVTLLAGTVAPPAGLCRALAIGDAATRMLAANGAQVVAITPEQGRLLRCHSTAPAPWGHVPPWHAARYATLALASQAAVPPGWTVWAHDDAGQPVVLAHVGRRVACLLLRPDSLLSGPFMPQLLRSTLAWCNAG